MFSKSLVFLKYRRQLSPINTPSRAILRCDLINQSYLAQVEGAESCIEYHAQWRAFLFVYLLVIYHQKQLYLTTGVTKHQCGVGKYGFQACHSSILPNLNHGLTKDNFSNSFIASHTLFNKWNNMTVAMPAIVNQHDNYLEASNREKLLHLIEESSFSKITVIEGIEKYFKIIEEGFFRLENNTNIKDLEKREPIKLIAQMQKNATDKLVDKIDKIPKVLLNKKDHEPIIDTVLRVQDNLLDKDKCSSFLLDVKKNAQDFLDEISENINSNLQIPRS